MIFSIGLVWYLTEKKILYKFNKNYKLKINNNKKCYNNIFEPYYTDLIYNTIGQFIYIILFFFKIIK